MKDFDRRRLIGAWQLTRWFVTDPDGSVTEPLGAEARGLMVFTRDGWATITLVAANRPRLPRRNPRSASIEQRAAALDTMFSYGCRWRVVGVTVELDVRLAQNPAMEGTVQVRRLGFRGRTLTTTSEEPVEQGVRMHRLLWRPATDRSLAARTPRSKGGSA